MSGPQGPVSPAGTHQLSFLGRNAILSFFIPRESQMFAASSSFGASESPAKQETAKRYIGICNIFVRNSKLQDIASFLK